jgi:Fe-S cluster biogenesis protein NfuA
MVPTGAEACGPGKKGAGVSWCVSGAGSTNPTVPLTLSASAGGTPAAGGEVAARVERVLGLIRPAVQSDGGDLELVEVTPGGVVRIRLHGACVGCPSSSITLKAGIERNLRQHVPEVRSVEAVD